MGFLYHVTSVLLTDWLAGHGFLVPAGSQLLEELLIVDWEQVFYQVFTQQLLY